MGWTRRVLLSAIASAVAAVTTEEEDDTVEYGKSYGSAYSATEPDCFIATAATGDGHPDVVQLRRFRDDILRKSRFGRVLIQVYYGVSPPVASWIAEQQWRQNFVHRFVVSPIASAVRPIQKKSNA